ncbi:hypothetical protein Tco_0174133 [Tanacetum coccineum]
MEFLEAIIQHDSMMRQGIWKKDKCKGIWSAPSCMPGWQQKLLIDRGADRIVPRAAGLVCVVLRRVCAKGEVTEAEYMALTEAVKEAIWLRGLLEELGVELNTVAVLEAKTVKVLKVSTEHNAADALTKVILGLKLQHCLELLNVGVG